MSKHQVIWERIVFLGMSAGLGLSLATLCTMFVNPAGFFMSSLGNVLYFVSQGNFVLSMGGSAFLYILAYLLGK
jgi:hypothetical protein